MRFRVFLIASFAMAQALGLLGLGFALEVLPFGVQRTGANSLWDKNQDLAVDQNANAGNGITIAVIDTGVDYNYSANGTIQYHPDLQGNIVEGLGFLYDGAGVEELSDYSDFDGHGTHVIGTITALDNDFGVIGCGPKIAVKALRIYSVYYANQEYAANEIAAAINWSVGNGCAIISMSLGLNNDYPVLRTACQNAYDHGLLLFAASGKNNTEGLEYPANYSTVIAVGAVDQYNDRWVDQTDRR